MPCSSPNTTFKCTFNFNSSQNCDISPLTENREFGGVWLIIRCLLITFNGWTWEWVVYRLFANLANRVGVEKWCSSNKQVISYYRSDKNGFKKTNTKQSDYENYN